MITCPAKEPEKSDATRAAIEEDHEENKNKMLEENYMISTQGNSDTKDPQKSDAIEEDYNKKKKNNNLDTELCGTAKVIRVAGATKAPKVPEKTEIIPTKLPAARDAMGTRGPGVNF